MSLVIARGGWSEISYVTEEGALNGFSGGGGGVMLSGVCNPPAILLALTLVRLTGCQGPRLARDPV